MQDAERLIARREECKERHGNGNGFGLTLNQWAKLYPTPNAADALGGRRAKPGTMSLTGKTPDGKKRSVPLASALSLTGCNGQLNPTWVEWLMGFPLGWTDLEGLETPSSPK
jgi:hypothetical protein